MWNMKAVSITIQKYCPMLKLLCCTQTDTNRQPDRPKTTCPRVFDSGGIEVFSRTYFLKCHLHSKQTLPVCFIIVGQCEDFDQFRSYGVIPLSLHDLYAKVANLMRQGKRDICKYWIGQFIKLTLSLFISWLCNSYSKNGKPWITKYMLKVKPLHI